MHKVLFSILHPVLSHFSRMTDISHAAFILTTDSALVSFCCNFRFLGLTHFSTRNTHSGPVYTWSLHTLTSCQASLQHQTPRDYSFSSVYTPFHLLPLLWMLMTSPATSLTRQQPSPTISLPTADRHTHIPLVSFFLPFTENEVLQVLCANHPTTCSSEPIPFYSFYSFYIMLQTWCQLT